MAKIKPHLFDAYTPTEMVDKLKRELDRYWDAKTREVREDHMMNFIWTAWHLYEWTWRGIETLDPDDRRKLERAVDATWQSKDDFRDWAKRQCPPLGACRQLSNTVKHAGSDDVSGDETPVDLTARPTMAVSNRDLSTIALIENWEHEIKYGEQWESAGIMFERILDFWTRAMGYGLCINW